MKMASRVRVMLILAAIFVWLANLSACAGNNVKRKDPHKIDERSLTNWLENDLIPYLIQQFGQHPRFKGQPILLVRMRNDNVQPHIDELTEHIRSRIVDALIKEPGLDLYWRPATRPHKHHQSLASISCGDRRSIHYYIGIDCRLTNFEQHLTVRVRALNLAEHKWVSGFGRSWQGQPTTKLLTALKREHPDEYLRGLRPLPFSDQQPDLVAIYLAHNLSCLLQQGDADELVVHVENTSAASPDFFKTTLKLVGKYLARFREVAVTDDPSQANVAVTAAIHPIHQNMYQIWLSALDRREKKYLPGAETEAYVWLESEKQQVATGIHQNPLQQSPEISQAIARFPALISAFNIITPANPKLCATDRPWQVGIRRLNAHERLATGSCLAVEIRLSFPAYLFLVGQDASGELTRLFPSGCQDFRMIAPVLPSGKLFQFPPLIDSGKHVLELGGAPGMERLYAVAITAPDVANRFRLQLSRLQGLCRPGRSFPEKLTVLGNWPSYDRINRWQQYLKNIEIQYPTKVQWREFTFWHDRPL